MDLPGLEVLSGGYPLYLSSNAPSPIPTFRGSERKSSLVTPKKISRGSVFYFSETILVTNGTDPEISVHSQNVSCHIKTKTIEEAYKMRDSLLGDGDTWVQCYGNFERPNGPNSISVTTSAYSLGTKR